MLRTLSHGPAALALVALVGCATPPRSWSFPTRVFKSTSSARPTRARNLRPSPHAGPAAALVERALHERGFRFGTDGTVGALFGYLHDNGRAVPPAEARAGDVVFFDLGDGTSCQDHVGLVESVDAGGRIAFREAREGLVRHSYLHAEERSSRRDPQGRILNTFLRPMRPDDPPSARYFAGDMLCAVLRIERRSPVEKLPGTRNGVTRRK
jgi:hypothetical protein